MTTLLLTSHSPQDTARYAATIAAELRPRDVLLLTGDLGAGKTTFTKALCAAMGVVDTVTSPTFTLVHEYRGSKLVVCHADLYRLERTGELADLGIAELVETGGVALVEWGDVVGDDIGDGLTITLSHVEGSEDSRRIEIGWRGKQWESRWDKLRSSLARWSA